MKQSILAAIALTISATVAHGASAPVVVKNTAFELNWLHAKQQIQQFNCQDNSTCRTLYDILKDVRRPSAVNSLVNKAIKYQYDHGNHWNSPDNIFQIRAGDCEDIVIAKIVLLKELGYDMNKVDVQVMKRLADGQYHLSMTYNGEQMDYMNLSGFKTLFSMKVNQQGLYIYKHYNQ